MCRRLNAVAAGLTIQALTWLAMCTFVASDYHEDMPPPCEHLHIKSNGFQPAYSGFYTLLENSTMHHRPTYRHTVCTFYLYYVDKSPLRFWLLGPMYGGPKGHVMAITDHMTPYMDMDWLTYNGQEGRWTYDEDFEVECLEPETELLVHWPLNSLHANSDLGPLGYDLSFQNMTFTRRSGVRLDQTDISLLYLDMTSRDTLDIDGDFTVSLWIYPETTGGIMQWMNKNSLFTTSIGLTIIFVNGIITVTPGYGSQTITVPYPLAVNLWHHLALTYSATTNKFNMFIDGERALDIMVVDLEDTVDEPFLFLGAAVPAGSVNIPMIWSRLGGMMACVRIYTGMLDYDSIMEIMERCEFHSGVEPLIHWPLNIETTTTDVIGHVFNLTSSGQLTHSEEGVVLRSQDVYSLYLDTTAGPGLALDADFSILFWIKSESDGGLIQWNNRLGEVIFSVGLSLAIISNTLYFFTGFVNSAADVYLVKPMPQDTWHHVALTYREASSDLEIYVDGTMAWQRNFTNLYSTMQNKPFVSIGDAYYFNNRKRFTGTIACVMIFNTTLERDAIMIELRMCQGRDLALNPEAFWPLNYNTTTSDVSQNSLHLTQVGSLVYDDGGVIFMDDPGQVLYLDTILGPPLSLDEAFSVVFWVKAHDDGVLLEWVNRLGFTVISLGLSLVIDDGRLGLVNGVVTAENPPFLTDAVLRKNKWYHVALTYHDMVSRARIYIDGELVWHMIIPDLDESVKKPYLYIGSGFANSGERFSGSMACLQLYNTALTEDELVGTLQMCENHLFDDYPVVNWPLNDITTIIDMSGHGFNLTQVGSVIHSKEGVMLDIQNSYELYLDMTHSRLMLDRDFTILFWVYPETDGGLVQWRNRLGDAPSIGLSLAVIGYKLNFFTTLTSESNLPEPIDTTLAEDKWCHVALTFKRETSMVSIYIDGSNVWQKVVPEIPEAIDKPYLYIGAADVFGTFFRITGKMACFEIFKYHMTEDNIEDVMDSCINFKVEKLPMANWPLNDMFMIADITGNGFNLTKVGSAPHSPEGVHFQSGTEYLLFLDMRDPPVLVLDRDFSIMFWIRPESDGGLLQWGNALNEISSIGLSMALLGDQLVMFQEAATVNQLPQETGMNLGEVRFYHVVMTYKKQQSLVQVYVDGEASWSMVMEDITEGVSKPILYIGRAEIFGTSFGITATMTCLRIYNYDLDAEEVESAKCESLHVDIGDPPRAYWPLNADTTVLDISGNGFDLTSIGIVDHDEEGVTLLQQNVFALYLDMTSELSLELTEDFSILLWVNYVAEGGILQWENHLGSTVISVGLSMVILGERLFIFTGFVTAENQPLEVEDALVPNRWYHIALVYDSQASVLTVYLDGHQVYARVLPNFNAAVNKPYLNFGSVYIDGSRKMSGKLACVMIFDVLLDDEDVVRKQAMCENLQRTKVLQAYWPLNENTTTADISGNQFNLTSEGEVVHGPEGVELDADEEFSLYLDMTEGPRLAVQHDFTIALWVKLESDGGLIQWQNAENSLIVSPGFALAVVDRQLHILNSKAPIQDRVHSTDIRLLFHRWYHIAITYHKVPGTVEIYLDGQMQFTKNILDLNEAVDEDFVYLGTATIQGEQKMSGELACMMIYSKALDTDEVRSMMTMCEGVSLDRLVEVAFWPLSVHSEARDISGHGYDLTAIGVEYNDMGVSIHPDDTLFLQTTPENAFHFLRHMSITMRVYCQTNGGILQFRNGTEMSSMLGLSVSHFNSDLTLIKGDIGDQENFNILTNVLSLEQWHHITLVFDAHTDNLTVIIDESLVWHDVIPGFLEAVNMPFLFIGSSILRNQATESLSQLTGKVACVGLYEGKLQMEDIAYTLERCTSIVGEVQLPDAIANWPLNEMTLKNDTSGNNLHLNLDGSVDHNDEGMVLTNEGYVYRFTDPELKLPDDFSLAFWIHAQASGGVLQWQNQLGSIVISVGLSLDVNEDGKLDLFTEFPTSQDQIHTIDKVITGKWHHVVLTYDKSNSNLTVFIDGKIHWSDTDPDFTAAVDKAKLYIGRTYRSFNQFSQMIGELACVIVYDQVLMKEQIKKLHDMCSALSIDRSPLANWPLNERTLTTDVTSNGFNLTSAGDLTFGEEGLMVSILGNYLLYLDQDAMQARLMLPGDFSIMFWFYPESDGGLFQFLDIFGSIATTVGLSVLYVSERLAIYKTLPQSAELAYEVDTMVLFKEKWHHVAILHKADTSNVTLYIDGHMIWHEHIEGINAAMDHAYIFLASAYFNPTIIARFNGKLTCFMIYDVLLREDEIRKAMMACESLEIDKHPIANWPLDMTVGLADVSGHGNNLTSEGAVTHTDAGVELHILQDFSLYWEIPPMFEHRLDHDFSILFWFNPSTDGGLFQFTNASNVEAFSVGLTLSFIANKLTLFTGFPVNINFPDEVDEELALQMWHHITVGYDAHDSNAVIYRDGRLVWTKMMPQLTDLLDFPKLLIGEHFYDADTKVGITGTLSCFKVYARLLAEEEIRTVMHSCDGILLEKGALVDWPLDDIHTISDVSRYDHNLTVEGTVHHEADGLHLDRNNNSLVYLQLAGKPDLMLDEDFSILFWVYPQETGGLFQWLNRLGSTVLALGLTLIYNEKQLIIMEELGGAIYTVNTPLDKNLWHHVGLVYSSMSSNLTLYIDGDPVWHQEIAELNDAVDFPYLYIGSAYPIINQLSRFTGRIACFKIYNTMLRKRDYERVLYMCPHVDLAVRTLAYWPLNMEHQTTDITGHGFNLTNAGVLFNETRGVSLGPNSGILFLDTTSGPRLQLLHDFTLTFWLLCETDGGFIQWLDLTENQQLESVGLSLSHFGGSLMLLEGIAGDSTKVHMINNLFEPGEWHHIGLVYDESMNNASLYLDGEMVWSKSILHLTETTDKHFIYIGQVFVVDGLSFTETRMTGKLACLGIHSGAYTEQDIEMDLGRCFREEEPLLLGFWPINQDMSTSDTSGNGFTLINTGVQFDALGINVETAGNAELYLDLTNGPTFRDGQDLSISLWVFLRSEGGILQWIDRTGQNVERIGLSLVYIENALRLYTQSIPSVSNMIVLDNTIQLNPWHHIVLSYDALVTNLTVYIDNILVFNAPVPDLIASMRRKTMYFGVAALIDGFSISITGQRLTGSIACLGFYQGAFGADGVAQQREACENFHLDPELVGYWPLNKLHQDSDISGNGNNLVDEGVDFDTFGVRLNDSTILYLNTNGGSVPAVLTDFSFTFWVKVQEQGGILQWVSPSPSQGQDIEIGLSLIYFNNILAVYTRSLILNQISNVITPDNWHYLTFTFSATSDMATIFIDGQSVWNRIMPNLQNDTHHDFLYFGAAAVSLGNSIPNSQTHFTGHMACFAVFNGVIDVTKIEEMMHDPQCPFETEPPTELAFWPLNNETRNLDTSGNILHLINSGVPFDEVGAELQSTVDILYLPIGILNFVIPADFSISFHIRPETQGGILQFADVTLSDVTSVGLSIALEDGLVVLYTDSAPTEKYIESAILQLHKWQHFLLTHKNKTSEVAVFIDGFEVWSNVIPDLHLAVDKSMMYLGAAVTGDTLPLQLGWVNRKMQGKMACLGIYDDVFTPAQVLDLMRECIEPDPLAFWPLNKVTRATDVTGNGYDLANQGIQFDQDTGLTLGSGTENQLVLDVRQNVLKLVDCITMNFWIYPESDGGIFQFLNLGNGNSLGLSVGVFSGVLSVYTGNIYVNITAIDYEWQHIGVVYDASRTTLTVYVDGDQAFTNNNVLMAIPVSSDFLNVGGIQSQIIQGWPSIEGKIACLTIFGQCLMKEDIEEDLEKCGSSIYVLPAAYAYWPLNMVSENTDTSGNGRNLVATDAVHFDNLIGVRLVNSSSYMLYHENPTVQQSGDLSILFWIYPVGDEGGILQWLNIEGGKASRIGFSVDYMEAGLGIFDGEISVPSDKLSFANILAPGQWNHVAMTYMDSSYQLSIYVNGEEEFSGTYSRIASITPYSHLFIGTTVWNSNMTFDNWHRLDGKIACFGLYTTVLHKTQIKQIMADCNVETDVPSPKAFWPLNVADLGFDTSGNGFDMSSFNVEFNQALGVYFPKNKDYVIYSQITQGENLVLYPDASITVRINPEEEGGILQYMGLNQDRSGFESVGLSILYIRNTISIFLDVSQESLTSYTFTENVIPTNEWTHVAISYDGSTSRASFYVNGIFQQTKAIPGLALSTNKTNLFVGVVRLTLPDDITMPFKGSIACLGLYNTALQDEHLASIMDGCKVDVMPETTTPEIAESVDCNRNPCSSNPCLHGGQCFNEQGCNVFSCFCRNSYQGALCECPPEFHYNPDIESCIKVVTSVKTEINNGDMYCQSLEQHGHANLASIQNQAENTFIKGLIACESNVFRQIATAGAAKGQLDCPELVFYQGISLEQCEENACLAGGNAFHYLASTQRCLVVYCSGGGLPTYKSGTNFDVYWLMEYNEVRREATSFQSSPLVITDFPLQAMHAVVIQIMCLSNTLTPIIELSGDGGTTVTFKFNYTANQLQLVISNGVQVLDQFATTSFSNTLFQFNGNYYTYWISWVNGLFEIGTGSNVGTNGILELQDPRYSNTKTYIHTLTLSMDADGILGGFAAEIHICDGYWTSGRKLLTSSTSFFWSGSSEAFSYNNWAVQPVSGTLQNCIYIDSNGQWRQEYCNVQLCLVCEVHMDEDRNDK